MKECYGNYMIYPICQGHYDCGDSGCFIRTSIDKGSCECPYKVSCHLPRQKFQTELRDKYGDKLEDCDAYKLLKPDYENAKNKQNYINNLSKKQGVNIICTK